MGKSLDRLPELRLRLLRERLLGSDLLADLRRLGVHEHVEFRLPGANIGHRDGIEVPVRHGEDTHDLLLDGHRLVLRLLEDLDGPCTAIELPARDRVQVRRKRRERLELPVLREIEPQTACDRLHRFDLRRAAHARDRDADVDRGADTSEEEIRLEEDLPVGNRDDVRRDVGRDVARLRFDDRERGQRAPGLEDGLVVDDRVVLAQLRGALEQARVEIEHVARIRFAPRWAAKDQRDLAVGRGLFRQVVVHAERGLPLVIHEVLGHRASRIRRDVLHWRGVGRGGRHDDRVVHGARLAELGLDAADRRRFLPDRDVDTDDPGALLIDDRVDRDGGLADGPVADDKLALPAADRDHRVDGLDTRLERLLHGLPHDDAGRLRFELPLHRRADLAEPVDRATEWIDDPSDERGADGHLEHARGAADVVALAELQIVAEDDRANVVFLEVERERGDGLAGFRRGDLEHLPGHRLLEPVDPRHPVADLEHRANFLNI